MNKNFPKSLQFYAIKGGFTFDMDAMEAQLESLRFHLCLPESGSSIGFISPFGNSELCYKLNNGCFIVKIRYQEKIVAKSEITRLLSEKAKLIEEEEGRLVRGRERLMLKTQVVEALRRTAQSRFKDSSIMVFPHLSLLCVLDASSALADDITSLFRKAIGSLPIYPAEPKALSLKALYKKDIQDPCFELVDKLKLCHPILPAKATFDSCNWDSGIDELLEDGFTVSAIGVHLCGFFSFLINTQGDIAEVRWSSDLTLKSDVEYVAPPTREDEEHDSEQAKREQDISVAIADIYLAQLGLEAFVTKFMGLFGGYVEYEGNLKDEGNMKDTSK